MDSQRGLKRKFTRPILRMAGMPESTRYTVISSTQPTVMSPSSRNSMCMAFSKNFLPLLAVLILGAGSWFCIIHASHVLYTHKGGSRNPGSHRYLSAF